MKILCKNKHWKINEDYGIDKILYLLVNKPTFISFFGTFIWKNKKGVWHRNYDLPALIYKNGTLQWHKNGKIHRENNKFAVICISGLKTYWKNGKHIKLK